MKLQGKKFAVLVEDLYEDLELWYPVLRLREEGAEVVIVGPQEGQTHKSKHGYPAKADRSAEDVSASEFDGLIIPGGYSPDRMRRCDAMVRLVTELGDQDKPLAAICHGPWMLCSAKQLNGRTATGFFAIKDDMVNAGCNFVDQEVAQDGNLITSRTPDDLPAFMTAFIEVAIGSTVKS